MKINRECLWDSIIKIEPSVVPAQLRLPEALKEAALTCFMRNDTLSLDSVIVRAALQELKESGEIQFEG